MDSAIIVALIAAVPATLTGLAAWRNARAANKAVNNRPKGDPSVSDDVRAIRHQVGTMQLQLTEHLLYHENKNL